MGIDPRKVTALNKPCGHTSHVGLDTCPTPDDLSDVDLNRPKFRAAFPDGKVPIRQLPMRIYQELTAPASTRAGEGQHLTLCANHTDELDVLDALFALHEKLDALEDFDVDNLMRLCEEYVDHETGGGDQNVAAYMQSVRDLGVIVREMCAEGLTLRQVARLVARTDEEVVRAAFGADHKRSPERVEQILRFDERVAEGLDPKRSMRSYALEFGFQPNLIQVRSIMSLRVLSAERKMSV